jgi:hypothetical protein
MFNMLKSVAVLAFGWAALQPSAQAQVQKDACRLEDARYTLKGDGAYTANFVAVKLDANATNESAVALHMHSTARGKDGASDFWLGIEQGNGYSYAELYVIADPALHGGAAVPRNGLPFENKAPELLRMPLLTVSKNMDLHSDGPWKLSDPAPELFAVPYLGSNLWYEGRHFSDQFNESNRERMPLGFFELSGCASPVN